MESDHTDQWEVLSQTSNTSSFHITSPIKTNVNDDQDSNKDNDNHSVHSMQSLESSITSTSTSIVNVNINEPQTVSHQPSNLIPQIVENKQMNENQNELIPSYVDIESELHQQRELINELKAQLNTVTNERNQVCLPFTPEISIEIEYIFYKQHYLK